MQKTFVSARLTRFGGFQRDNQLLNLGTDSSSSWMTAGFTLLELVVAFSLLAIAVMGIYSTMIYVQTANRINRETQLATTACQQRMEELLAEDWQKLPARDGESIQISGLPYPVGSNNNGKVIVDSTYISQNILKIIVTVKWKSLDKERSISLSTLTEKK